MFAGILILFLTIVLTVVGSIVAGNMQHRSWEIQKRRAVEDAQLARAQILADRLIEVCDKRLYKQRLFFWRLCGRDAEQIKQAVENYRDVLVEWNENFGFIRSNLMTLYRMELVKRFEDEINGEFQSIGRHLEMAYLNSELPSKDIERRLAVLSRKCFLFNDNLQTMIRDRSLPYFDDLHAIEFHNAHRLRTIDLIARLYGASPKLRRI